MSKGRSINLKTVVIADDHEIFRMGLKRLIDEDDEYQVIAEVNDGEGLLDVLMKRPSDMLVLDLNMPKISGLKILEEVKTHFPDLKVLILSVHDDVEHMKKSMRLGADGYLTKNDSSKMLLAAMKNVLMGKKYYPNIDLDRMGSDASDPCMDILSNRERSVLEGVVDGMTSKEIAFAMNIGVRTVESYRYKLQRKLGISTTAELVKYAVKNGLTKFDLA